MNILTATAGRAEIARVWCSAVSSTLTTPHVATVLYSGADPQCSCAALKVPAVSQVIGMTIDRYCDGPVRMFLEEDMVPVRPWSVDEYPGRLVAAQGNHHGQPWPGLTIMRDAGEPAVAIVPQRFVRDGGCPDWLPVELCEPAMRANAKVLGRHFLHLDKMYRPDVPEAAAKNELLELLRQRLSAGVGLGDLVAERLAAIGITKSRMQRVAAAIGVKDCGCSGRQAALNSLGRKLGIGVQPSEK
jgi:hypothetical protein